MKTWIAIGLLTLWTAPTFAEMLRVTIQEGPTGTKVLSTKLEPTQAEAKVLRSLPMYIVEGPGTPNIQYVEKLIPANSIEAFRYQARLFKEESQVDSFAGNEVRVISQQGPIENRVNLTILGDGYTASEKEKFFKDAERIAKGLFTGRTFASFLPLFNVYAVFVPSNVSGLGDGSSVGTAFGLYRTPKGSKRAIYPGNTSRIDQALALAPATDYPILLANDDYYGGLGGKYAITTRSELSGLVVLRHELGHNFGQVGEEYDNGSVYRGANSSNSGMSWSHWLTGPLKYHDAVLVSGDYIWKNLASGDYKAQFSIPNFINGFFFGMISSVGWQTPGDVEARLDGQVQTLTGTFNSDRNFYKLGPTPILNSGSHSIQISEKIRDGDNVLGFATLFAAPSSYDFNPNSIAAFATYDETGSKSYRPTHESCLMRDMAIDRFCPVDQENIWYQLLNRVSLIDTLIVGFHLGQQSVSLVTPPLSGLVIKWFGPSGAELSELQGQSSWLVGKYPSGNYSVSVEFKTPEVRKYNSKFSAKKNFTL